MLHYFVFYVCVFLVNMSGSALAVVLQLRAIKWYQSRHDVSTLGEACHVRRILRRTSIALLETESGMSIMLEVTKTPATTDWPYKA